MPREWASVQDVSDTYAAPESNAGPVVIDLALRWGDMDALGHINNVQIARLFEEARVRAFRTWFTGERPVGLVMLIARQEIEFTSVLHYSPEPARCEIWVSRIGGRSYDIACRLLDAAGAVAALCETTAVIADAQSGSPRAIPAAMRTALERRLGDSPPFRAR